MKISIVIPAKDEEKRLPRFLTKVIDYCHRSAHYYEVIVVDDGSCDGTALVAQSFQREFPSLKVISLPRNYGKGYAVKQGILSAVGDVVLFLDADGSTGPQEIERYLPLFDQGYDVIIGSRALNDKSFHIEAKAYRKWMGNIFNFLVSRMLIKGIKDTQCGFKMYRSSAAGLIFTNMHLQGFGFDLEALYLAQKMKCRIKEVPVDWVHVQGSKVNLLLDPLKMFLNIIQIRNWHQ